LKVPKPIKTAMIDERRVRDRARGGVLKRRAEQAI
jgi:hypothetical protein